MQRRLQLRLGAAARLVGQLLHENDGRHEHAVFSYAPEWQSAPDAFAISPGLPLGGGEFHLTREGNRSAIPAVMMDGGPDSWGRAVIRTGLGRRCGDLDYLLEVDDVLRTGALRYFNDEGTALAPPRAERIPGLAGMSELVRAARRFDAGLEGYPRRRAEFMAVAGSLGGARPKLCVADQAGGLWIAKLARTNDRLPVAKGEVLALHLARGAGIRAAQAELMPGMGEHPLALIRRFDRTEGGGRRHFISAQTMLGIDGAAPGDYVSMAEAIRSHGSSPAAQMAELWRRLVFTILVSNFDDHLRNHGFIYAGERGWQLSPAYDINPEPDRRGKLKTAISEIHGFQPSIDAAIDAAPFFDLDAGRAASIAGTMATHISDNWRPLGEKLGMNPAELRLYAAAFEHEEARTARRHVNRQETTTMSTPLHRAAQAGDVSRIAELIAGGADVNARNDLGVSPLHYAAGRHGREIITTLIELGADLHARTDTTLTPLHLAAMHNADPAAITALIEAGADVNAHSNDGRTALHEAALWNSEGAVATQALTLAGADVNARDAQGRTALHCAALGGNATTIRALIELGADPDARDRDGHPPLEVARRAGHAEAIQALVTAGQTEGQAPATAPAEDDSPSM